MVNDKNVNEIEVEEKTNKETLFWVGLDEIDISLALLYQLVFSTTKNSYLLIHVGFRVGETIKLNS